MTQPRRPAGTPTGGQFASTNRPEASGVELVDDFADHVTMPNAHGPSDHGSEGCAYDTYKLTDEERIAALVEYTVYGPNYDRNVVSAIDDYYHFNRLSEHDTAEHYLLLAELRADKYTWDQFLERDPFERINRERQGADVPQLTVEEPAAIAVRPEDLVWHHNDDNQNDDVANDRVDHLQAGVDAASMLSQEALVEAARGAKRLQEPIAPARPSANEMIARIFPDGEPQRYKRGHKLLPQELVERLPELYETEDTQLEDKVVYAHYFSAGADWYVCELDRETGEMFGHCDLGLGFPEWGYVRIQDLAELRGQFGLPVERELDFMPKTARELGLVKP